jgi:hypothetical protein
MKRIDRRTLMKQGCALAGAAVAAGEARWQPRTEVPVRVARGRTRFELPRASAAVLFF